MAMLSARGLVAWFSVVWMQQQQKYTCERVALQQEQQK
jgi:hypothetical protein